MDYTNLSHRIFNFGPSVSDVNMSGMVKKYAYVIYMRMGIENGTDKIHLNLRAHNFFCE